MLIRSLQIFGGIVALLLITAVCVFTHYYRQYAKIIDKELLNGPFSSTFNIFAEPHTLTVGDEIAPGDMVEELKRSGYTPSGARPRSYTSAPEMLTVYAPTDGGQQHVFRVEFAKNKIVRLSRDNQDVADCTLGPPLITNISPNREKRQLVRFSEIPPVLVQAVVSIEDKRFFQHGGLDLFRMAKAAYVDVKDQRKEQGASTLSMQLARGLWLQPDKRWRRKAAEILITMHLEHTLSKEQIFEYYSNQIFLGRRGTYSVHGFGEGAHAFFGKDLSQLTAPEAAVLAGVIQRPSYFNPFKYPDRVVQRRNIVLQMMQQNGYLTPEQYNQSVVAPLTLAKDFKEIGDEAPYFLDLVNDELQNKSKNLEGANYVYTTLDLNLQRAAADAIRIGMQEVDKRLPKKQRAAGDVPQVALIAINPHTGQIKALAGGRDYSTSQLDRVIAKRPPGSVFKPFVYAAALNTAIEGGKRRFTPASTVTDEPTVFWFNKEPYEPTNFHETTYGEVTLRRALAKSLNIATVKVAEGVGYDKVVAMARRAGLNDKILATPAVALGAYDTTPLEIAGAYTIFANGGEYVKPSLVATVKSQDGSVVFNQTPARHRALDPRVAYLMVSMLQDVMRSGTAAGVRSKGFTVPAAGKTGTSHDGWFAGFTTELLCVVWVGYDDYRELNLEGARSALPIWTEFMKRALRYPEYRNVKEFAQPKGLASLQICTDSGKPASPACPNTRSELFIAGTQPSGTCPLHDGEEPNFTMNDWERHVVKDTTSAVSHPWRIINLFHHNSSSSK